MTHADETLDATGLICPMPVLKAKKQLKSMPEGSVLKVIASDKSAPRDFIHFCETTGHSLLSSGQEGSNCIFYIRK